MAMLVLDFDGRAPHPQHLAARIRQRAPHLPALTVLRPEHDARVFPVCAEPPDPDVHLRYEQAATAADLPFLLADLLARPLPAPPHPPWDLRVIRVGHVNRFHLCYRIHHAVQDGIGGAHTLLALAADDPTPGPFPHPPARPTVRGILHAARELAAASRAARPRDPATGHPATSGRYSVDERDASERHLRELAHRHGSSVNDVCLAALALALGRAPRGSRPAEGPGGFPVAVPMSYRTNAERHAPGNRMLGYRLLLPTTARDLGEAVRLVRRTTEPLRRHRAKDSRRAALALLPDRLATAAAGAHTRATAAVVTSMTYPEPARVAGARMTGASALFPPDETLTAYISFTRACGRVRFTLVHDRSVRPPTALPENWLDALDTVPADPG